MGKIDFLEISTVLKYLMVISLLLAIGSIVKDGIAIFFLLAIVFFSLNKNFFRAIEFFFIWSLISEFFNGQGFITNDLISKYVAKPAFLLLLIFISFMDRIPSRLYNNKYIGVWIVFLLFTFLSAVTQGQSPFVIISISYFFMIYLLMQAKGISSKQYAKILNLFIAVAIVQTVVSFLQVSQMIAPSSKAMDIGGGLQDKWVAGLDDVASGTFGAAGGYVSSWYCALISLFVLLMWSVTKNWKYLMIFAIAFLQFATTDSKIIMGVTILMLCYMLFHIYKEKKRFKINIRKYVFFILLLGIVFFGFSKAWNSYYEYYGNKSGGSRTDLNAVYKDEGQTSVDLIITNISDWGKIKGYQYVYEDFANNNPIQLIWGYGVQGYTFNGKMGYIQRKDTPIMQLNNLTNNNSGLIYHFATSGVVGFLCFIIALFFWYQFNNNKKRVNKYSIIGNSLLNIFLPFSLLASFLYPVIITTIPITIFSAIVSICCKLSHYERIANQKKNKEYAIQEPISLT